MFFSCRVVFATKICFFEFFFGQLVINPYKMVPIRTKMVLIRKNNQFCVQRTKLGVVGVVGFFLFTTTTEQL